MLLLCYAVYHDNTILYSYNSSTIVVLMVLQEIVVHYLSFINTVKHDTVKCYSVYSTVLP